MATVGESLFSALLGLAGGVAGAGVVERLKAGVAALDVELMRLESFEDDLFDAFGVPPDDAGRQGLLRQLARQRRRLGQNIKRKIPDSIAYGTCKAELVRLDGFLVKAEDAEALTDDLEAQIQGTVLRLRSQVRRSSRTARTFSMLRGDD